MPKHPEALCKRCVHLLDKAPANLNQASWFQNGYAYCSYPIEPAPACVESTLGRLDIPYNRMISKDIIDGYVYNSQFRACSCFKAKGNVIEMPPAGVKTEVKPGDGPDPNLVEMLKSFRKENVDVAS